MDQKERLTGTFEHLLAFAFFIFPLGGNILGPLVLWLMRRQGSMFIDEQGKASLNFQLSMTLYGVLAAILSLAGVGLLMIPVIVVADGVCVIVAAVQAHRGDLFHYPVTIRFIH